MKKRKKLTKLNNHGMTLTELIVSFALLSIFMVAAMHFLSFTMSLYYNVKGNTYEMQVSKIIANKIASEIEGIQPSQTPEYGEDQKSISFTNRNNVYITISTVDELLNIHYDQVENSTGMEDEGGTGDVTYAFDAVDWKFDPKVYMGYKITNLTFQKARDGQAENADFRESVVRMDMTIKSNKYGEYTVCKYIDCNNK